MLLISWRLGWQADLASVSHRPDTFQSGNRPHVKINKLGRGIQPSVLNVRVRPQSGAEHGWDDEHHVPNDSHGVPR